MNHWRVAEGLIGHDGCGGDGLASCDGAELRDQAEDQPCKIGEQALVITQEDPQGLGQGEDELPVREGEQQLLIEVLGEQECSLLAAGWTEVGALAGKGTEVLVAAFGVRASDTRQAVAVVAASKETGNHSGNPLHAEVPELLRVARIVLGRESPEVVSEYLLEGIGPSLGVGETRWVGGCWSRLHITGNRRISRRASVRPRLCFKGESLRAI